VLEVETAVKSFTLKPELVANIDEALRHLLTEFMKLLREVKCRRSSPTVLVIWSVSQLSASPPSAASIVVAGGMDVVLRLLDVLVREPRSAHRWPTNPQSLVLVPLN
jgi:hypothetical protein